MEGYVPRLFIDEFKVYSGHPYTIGNPIPLSNDAAVKNLVGLIRVMIVKYDPLTVPPETRERLV
jgi:hypothetical protein